MKKDNILRQKLKKKFPMFGQSGSDTSDLNREIMRSVAKDSKQLDMNELTNLVEEHDKFLNSGGIGGFWQTINVNSLIVGIYAGPQNVNGKQAIINHRRIENIKWKNLSLPWSNLIGLYGLNVEFEGVDFSNSLMTDCYLIDVNFKGANLKNTDFSRSILTGANLQNADLSGTDFENCDLTGADFTNAIINEKSRFPGAILDNIKF